MKKALMVLIALFAMMMSSICAEAEIVNVKTGTATSIDFDTESGYVVACNGGTELSFEQMYQGAELYSVDIPEVIEGCTVKGIADNVFKNKVSIGRVFMPDTIEDIGEKAFWNSSVRGTTTTGEFVMPAALKTIGANAFEQSAVVSVVFQSPVEEIPENAFSNCCKLNNVELCDGVKFISQNAFSGCEALVGLKLPETLRAIGENAFKNCSSLTEVSIPADVTNIDASCFNGCSDLKKVIYNSQANIGSAMFKNCIALENVVLNDDIKVVGSDAFAGCRALCNIKLPKSVESIGADAFSGTNIADINIPASVKFMTKYSFRETPWWNAKIGEIIINNIYLDNKGAKGEVYIPGGVVTIAGGALENNTSVTNVYIPGTVARIDGGAFSGCTKLISIDIPDSVITLGDGVLMGCTSLESASLPDGIDKLPISTFYGCRELKDFEISQSVTEIGANAFYGCSSLAEITLPLGLKKIGEKAFAGSSVSNVVIPEGVEDIGEDFCDKETSLIKVYKDTFAHTYAEENGYNYEVIVKSVPVEDLAVEEVTLKYVTLSFGEVYSDNAIVQLSNDNGETWITANLFDIVLAEGGSVRVEYTQYDATYLARLLVADGYKAGYSNVVSFTTPQLSYEDGALFNFDKSLGKIRFYNGSNNGVLMLPETISGATVRTIGSDAIGGNFVFYGGQFKMVVMPQSMRTIKTGAFQYCHKLKEVIFNKDIEKIEDDAFTNCKNLKFICYKYTAAYDYAVANNIPYEIIPVEETPVSDLQIKEVFENNICVAFPKLYGAEKVIMGIREASGWEWVYDYECPTNVTEYWFYDLKYDTEYYIQMFVTGGEKRGTSNLIAVVTGLKPSKFEFDSKSGTIIGYNGSGGNVVIPSVIDKVEVTAIGDYAFRKTAYVKSIEIPQTVTTIGEGAFTDCGIANVIIPCSVTSIGAQAFNNCQNLNRVFFEGDCPKDMGKGIFDGCADDLQIIYNKKATGFSDGIEEINCISLDKVKSVLLAPEILDAAYGKGEYSFTVSASVLKDSETEIDAIMYIAIFNQDNMLVGGKAIEMEKFEAGSKTDIKENFSLPDYIAECYSVRVFLWDENAKLDPLTKSIDRYVYISDYVQQEK